MLKTAAFLLAFLLAGPAIAGGAPPAEHHAGHGAEAAVAEDGHAGAHQPKPLDNWFSLSFGPGKEKQNGPFAFAILNFVVLLWVVIRFGRRPLQGYLQQRHVAVRKDLEDAAALHREARSKLALIDEKLSNLDREIAETKAAVAKDAEEEKQRIVENAEKEAQRIVQQTEEIMKRELRNAQRRLEREAVDSAIRAAEKLIRQALNDDDRRRLNEEYYQQLTGPSQPSN